MAIKGQKAWAQMERRKRNQEILQSNLKVVVNQPVDLSSPVQEEEPTNAGA
jgi:hypothetical protein